MAPNGRQSLPRSARCAFSGQLLIHAPAFSERKIAKIPHVDAYCVLLTISARLLLFGSLASIINE